MPGQPKLVLVQLFSQRLGSCTTPARRFPRVRGCPPAFAGERWQGMPKVKPGQFTDVEVQRKTALTGGLLKKPIHITTKLFHAGAGEAEFVQLRKGQDWLSSSACGPVNRQHGLKRTKMAVDLMAAATAACGDVEEAPAPDDSPPSRDPMADFGYEDTLGDPPALAESDPSDDTPPKKARVRNRVVTLTMPAKCREMYPSCDDTRQVTCYVKDSRQIWISVEDVPWLVRYVHEQFCLGGVPLVEEGRAAAPAFAGQEGDGSTNAAAPALAGQGGADRISWDFTASAWVAEGRQLKPDEVPAEEAESLGVDTAAWRAFTYPEKKALAYKCLQHWLGQ